MGRLIAFRLCRSRVLAFAVALLAFFVSQGWATCTSGDFLYTQGLTTPECYSGRSCGTQQYPNVTKCSDVLQDCGHGCPGVAVYSAVIGGLPTNYYYTGNYVLGSSTCLNSNGGCTKNTNQGSCYYHTRCSTKCEADSVACKIAGNKWNSADCECIPDCHTKYCCDSLNQNTPVKTEKRWLGCVAESESDGCFEFNVGLSPGATQGANCSGKSQYELCTMYWYWSESAQQCAPLATNNCTTYTTTDSLCSKVICQKIEKREIGNIDFNIVTKVYSGTVTVVKMVVCSNGTREDLGTTQTPFQVSKDYLDRHNMSIADYIRGGSGVSGYTGVATGSGGSGSGGGSGGSGGSGGGGGSEVGGGDGGVDDGMGDAYAGGEGVDAQGNPITNSPSPGVGGNWSPNPQVVTTTDSSGNIQIVKNSQGGDSVRVTDTFNKVTCLGVSNGIATLTNGLSTWTCEALSCSQATLSSAINGGACSPGAHGITTSESNSGIVQVTGDSSWWYIQSLKEFEMLRQALERVNANMNANSILAQRQRDSIAAAQERMWKVTFGNNLSYVDSIRARMVSNGQAISGLGTTIENGFSSVVDAVGNISGGGSVNMSPVVNAIQSASSANTAAVGNAANTVLAGVENVGHAIYSASSANSGAIGSAASYIVESTTGAIYSVSSANSQAIGSAASYIVESTDRISTAVSASSREISDAVSASSRNIVNAIGSMSSRDDGLVDTVHNSNQILERIEGAVADTGRNVTQAVKDIGSDVSLIPASIWSVDSNISSLAIKVDSFTRENLMNWSNDKLVMIVDSNVDKVVDAIDALDLNVDLDSISVIVEHDTILDSIDARLQVRSSQSMQFVNDTLDLARVYSQAFEEAKTDSNVALDSSVVVDMRSRSYVSGSDVVDPTNVDSVSSVLNSKLDSSNAYYNARSDSMTRSLVDSTLKYSGIDSGGAALRRFFDVPDNGCPRQCLDITLQIPQSMGGGETKIKFSEIVCDKKIIGNYGVLDFVKLVLRILTAYLSLMFIWNAMWYLNTGAKKK